MMAVMSRRETNKLKCRERILNASRRLFSENGYDNTMIDEIADMAEVSKATVYNYFPNKESLLLGITEEKLENVCHLISHDWEDAKNSGDKIYRVLEQFILDSLPNIDLSRRISYLNSCEKSPLYAARITMTDMIRNLVLKAQEEGVFRKDLDAEIIVDVLMGILLTVQFQWQRIETYSPEFLANKLDQLLKIMLAGIYAETP